MRSPAVSALFAVTFFAGSCSQVPPPAGSSVMEPHAAAPGSSEVKLDARIEGFTARRGTALAFVRLTNRSSQPVRVFTQPEKILGVMEVKGVMPVLYAWNGRGRRIVPVDAVVAETPEVTVAASEDVLLWLELGIDDWIEDSGFVGLSFSWTGSGAARGQSGRAETPPFAPWTDDAPGEERLAFPRRLNLPTFWVVQFGHLGSDTAPLSTRSRFLMAQCRRYDDAGVALHFAFRMRGEADDDSRLLYAAIAASAGSAEARELLLSACHDTARSRRKTAFLLLDALATRPDPAAWVVDAILSAAPQSPPLLAGTLARLKCPRAVPVLIDMMRTNPDPYEVDCAIEALGEIGDVEALPEIIDILPRHMKSLRRKEKEYLWDIADHVAPALAAFGPKSQVIDALIALLPSGVPGETIRPSVAEALGRVRAKKAVPLLLQNLAYPQAIRALGKIGDGRAAGPLAALVASKGRPAGAVPKRLEESDRDRLSAAKVALVLLSGKDGVEAFCRLLKDPSIVEKDKCGIIADLGAGGDERARRALIQLVTEGRDARLATAAARALASFEGDEVIDSLIEGLAASERFGDSYSDVMAFRDAATSTLTQLTGQHHGTNLLLWHIWATQRDRDKREGPRERE